MNVAAIQQWIDNLPVGTLFETNEIKVGLAPTDFGKKFKEAVFNGTFKNVDFVRVKSNNHHEYKRV